MNVVQAIARQALSRPKAPALITPNGVVSYEQLMGDVLRLASRMAQLGVRRGDVVGILARNSLPHVWLTLATAWLGGISVSLGTEGSDEDKARNAELCGVKFFFHGDVDVPKFATPGAVVRMSVRELFAQAPSPEPVRMVQAEPQDIWRIAFTSGTTGRPKAMKIAHEAMILKNHALGSIVPVLPQDRVLVQMGTGLVFAVTYWMRTLAAGAAVVARQESADKAWEALQLYQVTFLVTSPGNALGMLAVARGQGEAVRPASLRRTMLGGAAVSPAQRAQVRRELCENLLINYGASEVGMVALLNPALMDSDPACAGRLVDYLEVQAVDPKGQPIPPGQGEGLLRMRSATMASGYILSPDASVDDAQAFRDGWFYSKDIGRVALDGRVYLSGRASDVINLGGVKVDPARVEELLAREPGVLECAVVGVADQHAVVSLVAVIVPQGEVDWPRLQRRCAEVLPAIAVPRGFVTLDALPRNASGKVMRAELAKGIRRGSPGKTPVGVPA
ncbi:class I adenylate-forming enzyme family protein [Ramlibacter solisilvae]|uniref:Uncharacterized protein n=1 Tax=Ramlibacter tataouinensis TaxID=94132 RepID=A0A127JVE7_9BURK|nr:class I adenylate-forming enzyme family protein [Ramlibacter tataouinensis]AMO23849.1 hypothetical protein UC35_14425 [Ramlibacter tataouinensis]